MTTHSFALFDSFADEVFGGSQAAVVLNAASIGREQRIRIAREMGAPATCFVDSCKTGTVKTQFFSTVAELPMCGHGTIGMVTCLVESGALIFDQHGTIAVTLDLPAGPARVDVRKRQHDGRPLVMLEVAPSMYHPAAMDTARLAELLGIDTADFHPSLPMDVASASFTHLVVPVTGLQAIRRINPDLPGLTDFCIKNGIETVVACTTEVEQPGYTLHVRDFCPAVGVAESAAAGTTNAALAGYLIRHGHVTSQAGESVVVKAEQGHEINRPSTIVTEAEIHNGSIGRLTVGGIATRVIDGALHLPSAPQVQPSIPQQELQNA